VSPDLSAALATAAAVPRLLVAVDFDGVLAPIVDDPSTSAPLPASVAGLRELTGLPGTTVALLSGRALADLVRLSGLAEPVRFVGSHGAQWGSEPVPGFDAERAERLADLTRGFEDIAGRYGGVHVERKPISAVLHVRTASPAAAAAATGEAEHLLAHWDDLHVTRGKAVVDVSVLAADKGVALDALRASVQADAVVFAGDDVTDENAFARLRPGDVGVKVGPGDTAAAYRVDSPAAFADVLAALLRLRRLSVDPRHGWRGSTDDVSPGTG